MRTHDIGDAVTTSDPWFRPVDIATGPDGALYVADWYDRQVGHYLLAHYLRPADADDDGDE